MPAICFWIKHIRIIKLASFYFDVLDEESSYFHPLFLYNFLVLFA